MLYWHYQLVLSWYLHQQESHKLSLPKVFKFERSEPIDRTPETPGSNKKTVRGASCDGFDPLVQCSTLAEESFAKAETVYLFARPAGERFHHRRVLNMWKQRERRREARQGIHGS